MERATTDLRRLIRLHLALARMAALMRAANGAASLDAPGSSSEDAGRASEPSAVVPNAKALDRRHAALANGDMAKHSSGPTATAEHSTNGKTGFATGAGHHSGCAPLTWQAQEGSGVVSVSAVGPDRAVLVVTPPTEAPGIGWQPHRGSAEVATDMTAIADAVAAMSSDPEQQLCIIMEWVAGTRRLTAHSGGESVGSRGISCRMSATPRLPASVLEAFADMAGAHSHLCRYMSILTWLLSILQHLDTFPSVWPF